MVCHRNTVAVGLLFIAGAVRSQGLIDGEPLRYNYDYRCNGERVNVGHCRDDNDGSYCQVYYPDRPLHNGLMVQPVEKRGEIVARLNACSKGSKAQPARSATGQVTMAKAPGLGKAIWHPDSLADQMAEYFTVGGIKRRGGSAQGWFTDVYTAPRDFGPVSAVTFTQILVEADCTKSTSRLVQYAAYDEDQKLRSDGPVADQSFEKASPGSAAADEVDVLCGRQTEASGFKPAVGDGEYLRELTRTLLQIHQAKQH